MKTAIIIYLLSALRFYWWTNVAYSKGGVWQHDLPKSESFLWTIIPILNTIGAIITILCSPYMHSYGGAPYKEWQEPWHTRYSKFFGIKK